MQNDEMIEKYYKDLVSQITHTNLLENPEARKEVIQNMDLADPFIKNAFGNLTQLENLQELFLPDNRKYLIEAIKSSNIDSENKRFLISFEEELSLFLPMGGGGGSSSSNNKKTKESKEKAKDYLKILATIGLIIIHLDPLTNATKFQENLIESDRVDYLEEKHQTDSELRREELKLEKEKLEEFKKELDKHDTDDDNERKINEI